MSLLPAKLIPMRFHILGDALVDVVAGGLAKLPEADGDASAETMALRVGAFNGIGDEWKVSLNISMV